MNINFSYLQLGLVTLLVSLGWIGFERVSAPEMIVQQGLLTSLSSMWMVPFLALPALAALGHWLYQRLRGRFLPLAPNQSQATTAETRSTGGVHSRSNPNQPFSQLELQQWQWSFLEAPFDPNHGSIVARHILEI